MWFDLKVGTNHMKLAVVAEQTMSAIFNCILSGISAPMDILK